MKGQDNGIEIEVASDAPSNFIGTVEEDPSIAVSAGVDSDNGTNLSSNSNRRSPRKKMFIKTALAASLVVVVTFSIGYVSGIRIRNATNNKNEALVSSAKNQAALQDVTSSAVGSKSSKDSKSAKDDLIKELLARVEALKEGQEALEEGQRALKEGQDALKEGQKDLKDGQEDLRKGQKALKDVVVPCVGYDVSTDVCTIGEGPADNLNANDSNSGIGIRVGKSTGNIELKSISGDIKATTDGSFLTDVGKSIEMIFGTASDTANAKVYIGYGSSNQSTGNSIRMNKGSGGNIGIVSNQGRVFIFSGDGTAGNRGYLTGTCEKYQGNQRKDVCQG